MSRFAREHPDDFQERWEAQFDAGDRQRDERLFNDFMDKVEDEVHKHEDGCCEECNDQPDD